MKGANSTKVTGAKGGNDSEIEAGNSSESSDSDLSNQDDEDSTSDEPSSSKVESNSASDPELVPEKKASTARKPSKRAIEKALNEVS